MAWEGEGEGKQIVMAQELDWPRVAAFCHANGASGS